MRNQSDQSNQLIQLSKALDEADHVMVGAGSGLSTAAGYTYGGKRFQQLFGDFAAQYGIEDMYPGGFYPFGNFEEYWAWWGRHIYSTVMCRPRNQRMNACCNYLQTRIISC